jgi:hypothetical protein
MDHDVQARGADAQAVSQATGAAAESVAQEWET